MKVNVYTKLILILTISIGFLSLLFWPGCRAVVPSAAVIEKAKIETRSILDSLNRGENTIITDVKLLSQYFDGDMEKYLINYEIESGVDSSHIATSKATAFIEQNDDHWTYRFTFDETYERQLN
jgi:hypothetical protein